MILVTGATGTVGREVVAQLLAAGQRFRALTRDPSKARLDPKVELVSGDLARPETLPKALEGADHVFLLAAGPELGAQEQSLARAAKKAGVQHIVKLSVVGAGDPKPTTVASWHAAGEKAIQAEGIPWTFLRPTFFMSNAASWAGMVKGQGKVFGAYGDGKFAPIHPRDIAAVAVQALTSVGHEQKVYDLTGPQALSVAEQVRVLSEAAGRSIEYVPVPEAGARQGMEQAGLPPLLIQGLLEFAAWVRRGEAAGVTPSVEQVTGKKPLTFVDWAREHAGLFR